MKTLQERLKFTDGIFVEAIGFAGGIWLCWDADRVHVEEVSTFDQIITELVRDGHHQPWVLSVIYASPNPTVRDALWNYIMQLGNIINIPWLIIGDCNQPLTADDKQGGRPINRNRAAMLQTAIDTCHLLDLSFRGPRYTWTDMRHEPALIWGRIDRAWCNLL